MVWSGLAICATAGRMTKEEVAMVEELMQELIPRAKYRNRNGRGTARRTLRRSSVDRRYTVDTRVPSARRT